MKPKEYLRQLRRLDQMIDHKLTVAQMNFETKTGIKGMRYDKDRVQTSLTGDAVLDAIIEKDEVMKKIDEDIDKLNRMRNLIVDQIDRIDNELYREVLFKMYVQWRQYGTLLRVAAAMSPEHTYSYDHIKHIHGYALKRFGEVNTPLTPLI